MYNKCSSFLYVSDSQLLDEYIKFLTTRQQGFTIDSSEIIIIYLSVRRCLLQNKLLQLTRVVSEIIYVTNQLY